MRPTARISGSAKRKAAAAEVWNSYIESKKQRYRAGLLRRFCFFIKPFKDNPCRYGRAQPPYMAVQGLPGGLVQKTANGTYSAFIGLPDFILAHAGQAHGYPSDGFGISCNIFHTSNLFPKKLWRKYTLQCMERLENESKLSVHLDK